MSRARTIALTESVQQAPGKIRVDRAAGVIYGVKYLGSTSPNRHGQEGVDGTDYLEAAMKESIPIYEGRQIFIDHPEGRKATTERSVRDLIGSLKNCRIESGEAYADLHYLKGVPDAEKVVTIAESQPELIGLSHNADGRGRRDPKRRRYVIESIPAVRSVDVVTRPATTKSLYESQEPNVKTLKQILEAFKLEKNGVLVKLLEDEGMPMDAAPPATAVPAEAGDWRAKLCEAICHIVQDAELSPEQIKAKVNSILKMVGEEEKEEPKEPADKGTEPTAAKESRELATHRKEKGVRTLCESLKFSPTEKQVTSLAKLEEAEQRELIASLKGTPAAKTGARSHGFLPTTRLTESREVPKDSAERVKFLKSYRG